MYGIPMSYKHAIDRCSKLSECKCETRYYIIQLHLLDDIISNNNII